MKNIKIILFLTIFMLLAAGADQACTDFTVKAKDGTVVIGRSMEFAMDMKSQFVVHPRGEKVTSTTADGKKGLSWESKYGYLGIDAFGITEASLDGINEAGLSIEFLWFTESKYQPIKDKNFITIGDMGAWVMGNFATVEEVKKALPKISVVELYVPQMKLSPGLHVAIHDAKGNNIVIEFIDGQQKIYDNPIGVMTNLPDFEWHINNLRNYVSVGPTNIFAEKINGVKVENNGHGNGWLGIPGDWMPPSRFVRAALFVNASVEPKDAGEAVNLAAHILNTVDIFNGALIDNSNPKEPTYDFTRWIVIKDLKNKIAYYRSYDNLALRAIDLKKLNFDPGAAMNTMSIDGGNGIEDVTEKLM